MYATDSPKIILVVKTYTACIGHKSALKDAQLHIQCRVQASNGRCTLHTEYWIHYIDIRLFSAPVQLSKPPDLTVIPLCSLHSSDVGRRLIPQRSSTISRSQSRLSCSIRTGLSQDRFCEPAMPDSALRPRFDASPFGRHEEPTACTRKNLKGSCTSDGDVKRRDLKKSDRSCSCEVVVAIASHRARKKA